MAHSFPLPAALLLLIAPSCGNTSGPTAALSDQDMQKDQDLSGLHKAHFAEGCFWCAEEIFQSVRGVKSVINGYSGGTEPNPTYEEVSEGTTGHAEAVEVYYDSTVVDYPTLLKIFFASQDPTTPSRQGPDAGPQYRSVAFYDTPAQKALIEAYIHELDASGQYNSPIVTEVAPFVKFWPAEDYHQNYAERNPSQPYILGVSKPRFERFKAKMPEVLK
ncbi:MAG TPA: peptide-methionine (S)-S-oxide reductase MsrA [Flavobacteriales bacterium]|nr:peptide-methionine (S)-S-oxide reductase MsrA [Flavobacteriales bacterium]HRQ86469.1 peptide-methionine (S)-S-oxide reductase MsrA [Flavobacteriales bacterium]